MKASILASQYEYSVIDNVEDLPEVEALALCNRMLKVDANNQAREKAKSANGDSTAKVLTPEEREANKLARKEQGKSKHRYLKPLRQWDYQLRIFSLN